MKNIVLLETYFASWILRSEKGHVFHSGTWFIWETFRAEPTDFQLVLRLPELPQCVHAISQRTPAGAVWKFAFITNDRATVGGVQGLKQRCSITRMHNLYVWDHERPRGTYISCRLVLYLATLQTGTDTLPRDKWKNWSEAATPTYDISVVFGAAILQTMWKKHVHNLESQVSTRVWTVAQNCRGGDLGGLCSPEGQGWLLLVSCTLTWQLRFLKHMPFGSPIWGATCFFTPGVFVLNSVVAIVWGRSKYLLLRRGTGSAVLQWSNPLHHNLVGSWSSHLCFLAFNISSTWPSFCSKMVFFEKHVQIFGPPVTDLTAGALSFVLSCWAAGTFHMQSRTIAAKAGMNRTAGLFSTSKLPCQGCPWRRPPQMLRPKFDLQQNPTHFCLNVNSLIYDVIFDIYHFIYIYMYM